MTKPLISVIVPVHNAERYIARCMESILAQDYENYEIVAVVDNSDDASLGILKAYQKADKRVKITEKKIGNPGGARNAGLDNAKGDLIMFVDADDALYDDALSYLCGVLEKTKSDVVIGAYSGEEILEQPKKEQKVLDAHDAKIDMMYQKISSAPWAKLYRASVIGKTRFPKYMMAEDALFNYVVFSAAKKIVVDNHLCYRYIENERGLVLKPFNPARMDGLKAVAEMEKIATKAEEPEDILEAIHCSYFFNAFSSLCNMNDSKTGKKDYEKEYNELSEYVKKYAPVVVKSKNATKRQKRYARSIKRSVSGTLRAMKMVKKLRG